MAGASNIRAGKAFVELSVRDKASRGLKRAQRRLRAFGAGATAIGRQMTAAGLAGAAGFAFASRSFVRFDDKMREVAAVTSATEDQFASLRAEARRLGATTSFTATQVAGAMAELGRAGFDAGQILASTEGTLALAKATSTALPRAAEIAGAALRAFNLDVSQTGRVTDVLTAGANKSAQTLEDLFESFKLVAPIASAANESIETTVALLGILANNGIKGSRAGTGLARAYKNLATEASQANLRKLGVDAVDAAGNLRPMADIMNDLGHATNNLPTGKKLAIFESLFGRGQAAAIQLAGSSEAIQELQREINNSAGLAIDTAKMMESGLGGSFRRLLSAAESVMISVGKAIEGPMIAASRAAIVAAGWIDALVQMSPGLVKTIALATVGLAATGVTLLAVGGVATVTAIIFGALAASISAILTPIGLAITAGGALVGAVATVGAGIVLYSGVGAVALRLLGIQFSALLERWRPVVEAIRASLLRNDIGAAAKVMWAKLRVLWGEGAIKLQMIWAGMKAAFLTVLSEMWSGALAGLEMALHAIENAWASSIVFMANIFDRFIAGVNKAWSGIVTEVAKVALDLNPTLTAEQKVEGKALLEQEDTAFQSKVDSDTRRSIDDRNQRRADKRTRADERHQAVLKGIVKDADATKKKINESAGESVKNAVADLQRAKEELDAAIVAASSDGAGLGDGGDDGAAGGIRKMVQDVFDALNGLSDRTGFSSRGTFSGAAAADLGNRKLETLVSVSERIADNTARMVRQNETNGMTFS